MQLFTRSIPKPHPGTKRKGRTIRASLFSKLNFFWISHQRSFFVGISKYRIEARYNPNSHLAPRYGSQKKSPTNIYFTNIP